MIQILRRGSPFFSLLLLAILLMACTVTFAGPKLATAARPQPDTAQCAPGVDLYGFSDALDKQTFEGTDVGGLSGLTYDAGKDVYYALVDNQGTTPARFYTLRLPTRDTGLGKPKIAWQGVGPMPEAERQKLHEIVATAHANGQRVRFWATPEIQGAGEAVWQELLAAEVDYINTDNLGALQTFLLANDPRPTDPYVYWNG